MCDKKASAVSLARRRAGGAALFLFANLFFAVSAHAQKLAVIVPEKNPESFTFAEKLETSLSGRVKILDSSLTETAFASVAVENIFNQTKAESKTAAAAVGCDFLLIVKTVSQRRAALSRNDYYEAFAIVYAVSARSGRLVFWKLQSFEDENKAHAEKRLLESSGDLATEITAALKIVKKEEIGEKPPPPLAEMPPEDSPDAKSLRPPLPFKRLKPEYTRTAYLYGVAATIDVEVDIDEAGQVTRAEIVRWAGFGLDESVLRAVRTMNWRAAERNGKTLPMRILLRYNFKKLAES